MLWLKDSTQASLGEGRARPRLCTLQGAGGQACMCVGGAAMDGGVAEDMSFRSREEVPA